MEYAKTHEGIKALILYVTSYGYTRQIADFIKDYLTDKYQAEVESYNVIEHEMDMFAKNRRSGSAIDWFADYQPGCLKTDLGCYRINYPVCQ